MVFQTTIITQILGGTSAAQEVFLLFRQVIFVKLKEKKKMSEKMKLTPH